MTADGLDEPKAIVLIVDDDSSIRGALVNLVESVGLEARAFGSIEAFSDAPLPDADICLVLDIRMPGRNGLDFLEELARDGNRMPVVMITAHGDIPMSVRAMKAGAIEFLPKPFAEHAFLDAVHAGLARSSSVRRAAGVQAGLSSRIASLSARESEVMEMVMAGLLTKQIAHQLDLSEITVKICRAQMMRKLGVGSLIELGRFSERRKAT